MNNEIQEWKAEHKDLEGEKEKIMYEELVVPITENTEKRVIGNLWNQTKSKKIT